MAHLAAVKAGKRPGPERYTDDTAMARQIALSFVEERKLDTGSIARRFTEEYFTEPARGYGGAVRAVFKALREEDCSEPHGPAARQFGGSGSYGNGAGMRAHPVALAMALGATEAEVAEKARAVARITHSHELGVLGGAAQTVAVWHALRGGKVEDVREAVEGLVEDSIDWSMKMGVIHRSLGVDTDSDEGLEEVVLGGEEAQGLGNGVEALHSVPTALFCFLKVLGDEVTFPGEVEGERTPEAAQRLFESVLVLAVRCGGDTDTIASMACAIAGAALGQQAIHPALAGGCEAAAEMRELAGAMWRVVQEERREEGVPSEPKRPKL
jgi:poly(ADP-ribose) glycohydrolase ARH3